MAEYSCAPFGRIDSVPFRPSDSASAPRFLVIGDRRPRTGSRLSERRLRGVGGGVSVMMRYTLRLLTLDQLSRAAGLVCALELERQQAAGRYGDWPFEIGLWVGKAATPNIMGRKGDGRSDSARAKVRQFKSNPRGKPSPIPLEECPWCGERFTADSFSLLPDDDSADRAADRLHEPRLRVQWRPYAADRRRRRSALPATSRVPHRHGRQVRHAAVDRPLRRAARRRRSRRRARLLRCRGTRARPAAAGAGRAAGPRHPGRAAPHLRAARHDGGAVRDGDRAAVRARGRRAPGAPEDRRVDGDGPPCAGPDPGAVRASADAGVPAAGPRSRATRSSPGPSRRRGRRPGCYVGVAAQGRNPKVVMRKVWLALMGAAEHLYREAGGHENHDNPADPYMTLLGYFNSLRELGGARRIVEDEVRNTRHRATAAAAAGRRAAIASVRRPHGRSRRSSS